MVFKVRNSGLGIGDQVCGLYSCQALKDANPTSEVVYFSRHHKWFVDVKDITVRPYHEYVGNPPARIDVYLDATAEAYVKQLPKTRKQIYTARLDQQGLLPKVPNLKVRKHQSQFDVVLFPFAAWRYREWPLKNWLSLERLFRKAGLKTMVLGTSDRAVELSRFEGEKEFGLTPDQVIERMLGGRCVVSNDSGMAHLAGLYKVPVVSVISSMFSGNHLFSGTVNHAVSDVSLDRIPVGRVFAKVVEGLERPQLETDRKILLRAGDFGPSSQGGIYNSSLFSWEGKNYLLSRVERLSEFQRKRSSTAEPYLVKLDANFEVEWFRPILFDGFPLECRIEDFRVFHFQGQVFVSHPLIPVNGEGTHQAISRLDMSNFKLSLVERPILPFMGKVEKNWVFFEHNAELMLVYTACPYRLYRKTKLGFEAVVEASFDVPWSKGHLVSNSTNVVCFDRDHYLVFIHVRDNMGVYHQGILLINRNTLRPTHVSKYPIYHSHHVEGLRRGVIYFMGAVSVNDSITVSMGEGDYHTSIRSFSKKEIWANLIPLF